RAMSAAVHTAAVAATSTSAEMAPPCTRSPTVVTSLRNGSRMRAWSRSSATTSIASSRASGEPAMAWRTMSAFGGTARGSLSQSERSEEQRLEMGADGGGLGHDHEPGERQDAGDRPPGAAPREDRRRGCRVPSEERRRRREGEQEEDRPHGQHEAGLGDHDAVEDDVAGEDHVEQLDGAPAG